MDAISTGDGNGIKLEEYKGNYSLTAQRENNGKYYPQWAKYQKGKNEHQEKDWPVKVTLGDKETAVGVLKMLLSELGEESPF
jgi:hypothetical protein